MHLILRLFRSRAYNTKMDVSSLRIKYKDKMNTFVEDNIPVKEPFNQFKIWFDEVLKNKDILEPNAMCLSTATKNGLPSSRYVLLKQFDKEFGFKFFTNCNSRKGKELSENPNVALLFYWVQYNRQVRVEGIVKKLPDEEATKYFLSRPYESQIGAMASDQSLPVPSRDYLCCKGEELQKKYPDKKDIVKPTEWGGFQVIPHAFEFWQGQSDRLHDRIRFRRPKDQNEKPDGVLLHQGEEGWFYERLAP